MEVKYCPRCKMTLSVDAFQRCSRNGRQTHCRSCKRAYAEALRLRDVAGWRRKRREGRARRGPTSVSPEKKARLAEYFRAYRAANKGHTQARSAVSNAVRDGVLVKPAACVCCAQVGTIEAHHEDYTKPLVVTWLCRPCHRTAHRIARFGA